MILAAGFKVHALIAPAHGPVDLPGQLAVGVGLEVKVSFVAAAGAGVVGFGLIFRKIVDGGEVGVALGAENADGIVLGLLLVVLLLALFFTDALLVLLEKFTYQEINQMKPWQVSRELQNAWGKLYNVAVPVFETAEFEAEKKVS